MSKKFKSKGKVVNKLTRDGVIEQNLATGEINAVSKKDKSINFSDNKKAADIDFKVTETETKKSMKKAYQNHYRENNLKNTEENINNSETNIIKNNSEYTISENLYNDNFVKQEVKEDNVFSKSEYQDTGISSAAVKNSDFKENNTDTGRKHSQTYRSLKFNQAENREISSSDRFEKIEKQEKFIDDNFNVFKNSDENKSFSDETKNSSFMVVENAHSLKYEKASNKKFKDKTTLSKTKLNTSVKSNLQFSDSKNSLEDNKKTKGKQKQPKTENVQDILAESNLKFKDNKASLKINNEVQTEQKQTSKQKKLNISDKSNLRFSDNEKPLNTDNEIKAEIKEHIKSEKFDTSDKSNLRFSDNKKPLSNSNNIKEKIKNKQLAKQKKLNISDKSNLRFSDDEKTLDRGNEIKTEIKQSVKQEKLNTFDKSNVIFSDDEEFSKSNDVKTEYKPKKQTNKKDLNISVKPNLQFSDSKKTLNFDDETEKEQTEENKKGILFEVPRLKLTKDETEKEIETKTDTIHSESENKGENKNNKSSRLKFFDDEKPLNENSVSKKEVSPKEKTSYNKLQKLEKKIEKTEIKLEKAKNKLPSKKKLKAKRVFDENKQKPKIKLQFEKEVIPQSKFNSKSFSPVRYGAGFVKNKAINKVHQKMSEVENENVSIKAVHRTEQVIENYLRFGSTKKSVFRFVRNTPYRRVNKLEEKAGRLSFKHSYEKIKSENMKTSKSLFSKFLQKRKIKKQYAKKVRETKRTVNKARKTAGAAINISKKAVNMVLKNPKVIIIAAVILLIVVIIMAVFNLFSSVAAGGIAPVVSTSYTASDTNIDKAELAYTEWETDLLLKAKDAPNTHPDYNEYKYNLADVSHNPYELMAFLTVKYHQFEYEDIEDDLRDIFDKQYKLTYTKTTEIRKGAFGQTYEWKILNVNLTAKSFTDVIAPLLNDEEKQLFDVYMQTKGNRQYMDSPFDFNWLNKVSSNYGYRVYNGKNNHKGVDISVPAGTDIRSGHNGVVKESAYSSSYGYYVVIDGEKGLQSKYAHCSTLLVSVGQEVKKGDIIAKSGNTGDSTGAHLHLEILKDGKYLNPMYFVVTNDKGGGSSFDGTVESPAFGTPGAAIGDGSYQALIAEAEKYLGRAYVFGGSSPSTGFDCSGFVCWVYTHSGVHNLPRTTAQGIFNQCTPIPKSEVKPGDLVFFTKTYSTSNTVTHVGIYVGNDKMIHCGDVRPDRTKVEVDERREKSRYYPVR